MSAIQSISSNKLYETQPLTDKRKVVTLRTPNSSLERDKVSFSATKDESNEKVTFGEGVKLVAQGFWNKVKDIGKAIIHNPVKTLGAVALTTAGLAALPLIGVSMATGAAALALGFATLAVGKTIVHTGQAIKHNGNGEYNKVREDLQKIGGDGLDLALSLPFVPKALKQVQRHVKYNPSLLYINKEMVADLRNAKGVRDVAYSFLKGDLRVKYHQITNEMGFKVKPELVFEENIPAQLGGLYDPTTGQMKMNTSFLNPINRLKMKAGMKATGQKPAVSNLSPEGFLRHELEHVRQFQDIARTENLGVTGLTEAIKRYHAERVPQLQQGMEQTKTQLEMLKDPVAGKAKIEAQIDAQIKSQIDTQLAAMPEAQREMARVQLEMQAGLGKIQPMSQLEAQVKQIQSMPKQVIKAQTTELERTLKYLESEATLSQQVATNPQTAINTGFYQQAAQQGKTIKAGTQEASLAKQYLDGFMDKLNDGQKMQELNQRAAVSGMSMGELNDEMMKIYKGNLIEQEAYGAQELYITNNIKGRPGMGTVLVQETSAIS